MIGYGGLLIDFDGAAATTARSGDNKDCDSIHSRKGIGNVTKESAS